MKQKSNVALPLSKRNKTLVSIASILFMFYVASHGTAIAISQSFILTKIGGMSYFSLSVILVALGSAIITPIGGKLGDIVGRKTLMASAGGLAFVTTVGMAYSPNIIIYLVLTTINSLSKGAFVASPYIIMHQINKIEDVPKATGLLASGVAAGTLFGALVSGVFNDMGQVELGLIINGLVVLVEVGLVLFALPNTKSKTKIKLDVVGIALLAIVISSFVLSFNFAPTAGWTNPLILIGFAVLIVSLVIFINYEKKVEARKEDAIIPMSLFANKEFSILLIVGLIAYFYQTVLVDYGSLASLEILNESATVTGMLTLPRTAIVLIIPTFLGVWVGKKKSNLWKAMALATAMLEKVFNLNVFSPFYSSRSAVNIFKKQGSGNIINISSLGGLFGARAGAAYTASKHALVGLTKNTAFMYSKANIRCNAICPGGIATEIGTGEFMSDINQEGMAMVMTGVAGNPREGAGSEVATVALFLASEDSSYVNGQCIALDGGWTAY